MIIEPFLPHQSILVDQIYDYFETPKFIDDFKLEKYITNDHCFSVSVYKSELGCIGYIAIIPDEHNGATLNVLMFEADGEQPSKQSSDTVSLYLRQDGKSFGCPENVRKVLQTIKDGTNTLSKLYESKNKKSIVKAIAKSLGFKS